MGAHQQFHPWIAALMIEQFKAVRFPVAHGDHARASAHLAHGPRNVGETVEPAPGPRPRRGGAVAGRIEPQPQHAERQAGPGHRQRRVQMQPQALRPGLVFADHPQPVAARAGGEVQIRAVLDRKHRALRAQPLNAARAMRRQDVLRRDLRLRRHLDQPVERIDCGTVAGAVGVDLLSRVGRQKPHALDQSCREPFVAQGRSSKLVCGPIGRVQTVARLQNRRVVDPRNPKHPAPVVGQFVDEHRLDRLRAPLVAVLTAAARRLADTPEIGRPEAGAIVARIGKTLHEPGAKPVAHLEIPRQAPQQAPEHVARQMRTTHRRPDQETTQPDHPVKMRPALLLTPRHPAVSRRYPQRRGGKPRGPQPTLRRTHQVAKLTAGKSRHPARMLARHQRVPQGALGCRLDKRHRQTGDLRRMRGNADRLGHRRRQLARRVAHRPNPWRRQLHLRRPLGEARQCLHAARHLQPAQRVDKPKLLADPASQRSTTVKPFLRENPNNPRSCRRIAQGPADLRLVPTWHRYTPPNSCCPALFVMTWQG